MTTLDEFEGIDSEEALRAAVAVPDDPMFQEAKLCLRQNNYDDAIDFLAAIVQNRTLSFGDESIHCASALFHYADALLTKEEDRPSETLLGNGNEEKKPEDVEVNDESGDEENKNNDNNNANNEQDDDEEDVDDIQLAWESFEVVRKAYERFVDKYPAVIKPLLAKVYTRLGNLQEISENLSDAISEFRKALVIREEYCTQSDRLLAESYLMLGRSLNCFATSKRESDEVEISVESKLSHQNEAILCYGKSRETLLKYLAEKQSQLEAMESTEETKKDREALESDIFDCKELCEEIQDILGSIREEIKSLGEGASSSSSSSSGLSSGVTTQIGFGNKSSNSTNAIFLNAEKKMVGSTSTSTSASAASSAASSSTTAGAISSSSTSTVNTLQARSKRKPAAVETPATTDDNKKAKTEE